MMRQLNSQTVVGGDLAAWASEIVRSIYPHGPCEHSDWHLCRRQQKTMVTLRIQCLLCGRSSSAIGRADMRARGISDAHLPAYDETLLERRMEEQFLRAKDDDIAERKRRSEEYAAYLQSDAWSLKRRMVMIRAGGICEGCGERQAEQVHHLHYRRIFREMLFDLVAVCRQCHEAIHASGDDDR